MSTSMGVGGKIHGIGSIGFEDGGIVIQGTVVLSNGIPIDWRISLLIGKRILV